MRKLSKNAWVFDMSVQGVDQDSDNAIQELIEKSGGLMLGKRKFSKGMTYLLIVDLLALDIIITAMSDEYPCGVKYRKAREIRF